MSIRAGAWDEGSFPKGDPTGSLIFICLSIAQAESLCYQFRGLGGEFEGRVGATYEKLPPVLPSKIFPFPYPSSTIPA
jgi:hypothetical protein